MDNNLCFIKYEFTDISELKQSTERKRKYLLNFVKTFRSREIGSVSNSYRIEMADHEKQALQEYNNLWLGRLGRGGIYKRTTRKNRVALLPGTPILNAIKRKLLSRCCKC
ncbi:hypothetical protein GWI33_019823 [Rhynchophorus ferrugineus]|uniref:Uncharacterized protein n=1 Tax=Rhynchophorus ferrugineus TaxID=354439 RepID=A0A834M6K2_RHYFE|nr:hypothetical protein GWI33_019823 [Rhynchophorus ferrugineus]